MINEQELTIRSGEALRDWRKARGWTQAQLSEALGLSKRQIANLESAETGLSRRDELALRAIDAGLDDDAPITDDLVVRLLIGGDDQLPPRFWELFTYLKRQFPKAFDGNTPLIFMIKEIAAKAR